MQQRPQALIIDDEPDILDLLLMTLDAMGIDCRTAETVAQAELALQEQAFDICLTDMQLPDGDGIDLVKTMQKKYPQIPVAVITAYGNMELAILALKSGAFDFVSKPLKVKVLRDLVNTALNLAKKDQVSKNKAPEAQKTDHQLLGETPAISDVYDKITKLARSQAPVYISGESGTGKELVARLIHSMGGRADSPFIAVNCGAIPFELVESELFGHRKGSFTGAVADKEGLFQAANGGTLFLDEIADLPLLMQVKLLRVIQEKSVRAIGDNKETSVNVRILCATHKDLAEKVKQGKFREDLFYRVSVIELPVPPLRERIADIPLLSNHILKKLANTNGMQVATLSKEAEEALKRYHFPGNVRELENILERALTWLQDDGKREISVADLGLSDVEVENKAPQTNSTPTQDTDSQPLQENQAPSEHNLESQLEQQERQLIIQALESVRWNKTAAAKKLGISFRALRYKLDKLDIK